ncbi:multidrug resistance-associated protein 1-like isoform X5 [Branchiostoma floridae]|uniref:Multidrug resistance-associated protein 1-like isoform X5 n=1 Tax=Branchiostoma floridae TaxID=7739 RepID=A0A9J7NA73_BRAFL|nr:multidrug resistance-associated protein 1-like isoform X5 [Branchiostoma floridae]
MAGSQYPGLDRFCGSTFWDYPLLDSADPDLTPCFQKTVLVWIPCFFLWAVAPLYYLFLHRHNRGYIQMSKMNKAKTALAALLVLVTLLDLFRALWEYTNGVKVPAVNFVSPLILAMSMGLAGFFIQYERLKGRQSSGVLFLFWLLATLCGIVTFRSNIRVALLEGGVSDTFRFVTFYLYFPLVLTELILSAFSERAPLFSEANRDPKPSPEESCSFLSKITFWWFNPLVILGYKRALERADLYSLNHVDRSDHVVPAFEKEWQKERQKCHSSLKQGSTTGPERFESQDAKVVYNGPQGAGKDKSELIAGKGEVEIVEGSESAKKCNPSLFKALVRCFWPLFAVSAIYKLIQDILLFVSPQLLKLLIAFTKDKDIYSWKGYLYAVLLLLVAIIQSLVLHQYFHGCFVMGMRLRTVIISAVYKKSLVVTNEARKSSTVGEIVNLMSVDAQRFMDLSTYLHMIWSAPFQIAVSLYFLWQTLGPSILAGLGVMILLIPINIVMANKTKQLQVKQMIQKDARIKLMNEVLNGIKVLKLYAWELSFKEKIEKIRSKELQILRNTAFLNAGASFTWVCAPFLVSLTTFAVYVLVDERNILDAEKAFVALSLFNILRFPLNMLPNLITSMVQARVSLQRLENFLGHDELDPNNVDRHVARGPPIAIEDGTFSWGKTEDPILKDISFAVPDGSLVAVVGQVGAGKSSLLSALLGEMEKQHGYVAVRGSTAFVPQQAWIQNATLRDNILFGKRLNNCQYKEVLEACALGPDLEMLPGGDMTEIGEKGINLSGGQKQRVSLARAVYSDSNIYYLDDPLSAVDAHVGKHIFDNVIGPNGILKGKTRLLVTHGISFLPQCDQIMVLVDGKIWLLGTYTELMEQNEAFAEFIHNYGNFEDEEENEEGDPTVMSLREEDIGVLVDDDPSLPAQNAEEDNPITQARRLLARQMSRDSRVRTTSMRSDMSLSEKGSQRSLHRSHEGSPDGLTGKLDGIAKPIPLKRVLSHEQKCQLPQKKEEGDKLIQKEVAETGRVKASVFVEYLRSVGITLSVIICLLYCAQNAASIYSNIWLSEWSNDQPINGTQDIAKRDLRLGVYGALGVAQGLLTLAGDSLLTLGVIHASMCLHRDMLANILRLSLTFFDVTPLGRIVNRFSLDVEILDTKLFWILSDMVYCFFEVLNIIIVVSIATPLFLTAMVPLVILYYFIQRFYVATSRQLKRIESISRSPIYSHFGETVQGTSTIRAYDRGEQFFFQNQAKVDENQVAYYPMIVSNRWLALRLEFVGNCIVLFAALFAVIGRETLSPGIVGLSITYALQITQTLNWMVRMTSELETNIVAVERIKEYAETPTEAEWVVDDNRPPDNWPSEGKVNFNSYQTRYREGLDLVIKGIDVTIKGGEKIGIVGRTGAGKSSLTLAIFRIIEAAGGDIEIDGVNISKIGLHDLRGRITIIPQDPVLFSGTLRMNLDPFDSCSDQDIWVALELSHLKDFVMGLGAQLEHEVSEGGENLSVGQRQLVCLARALLRKSKILVLDEATAAVDLETDDLIQSTIRTQFADCTVLTIAHRLNTIMDSTRVLVLDAGRIAEFDSPQDLIASRGIFYGMAKDAGLAS